MAFSIHAITTEEKSALIALPEELTCKDRRRFRIVSWEPVLSVNSLPTATIRVIIEPPEGALTTKYKDNGR